MSRKRQILIGLSVVLITGVAIAEHLYRRIFQQRYEVAVVEQARLEDEVQRLHLSNGELKTNLQKESKRAEQLHVSLDEKNRQFDEVLARLSEETKTVRELQVRLDIMQSQMDHLQGELLVAIDKQVERQQQAKEGGVELQKVVVGDASAPADANIEGRVISVHPDWSFVIVNLGWDTVSIGDTIHIYRGEALQAEARIERVQEGLAAATLLPQWKIEGVQVNDTVRGL